jgi:AmmeMemoRadiSam system protein B
VSVVREPVAAGTFYPGDPRTLRRTIDALLADAHERLVAPPWGVVVPHAGYVYSGPIAATAYAAVRPWAGRIRRVLLLGPAHFVPLAGLAVAVADAWGTPLGEVPIDPRGRDAAVAAGCVADDAPLAPEHSLEVQVPFLQRIVGDGLSLVPVAVGASPPGDVAALLGALEADLVVVSTDLTHYLDHATARALDRRTAEAVVRGRHEEIGPGDACGVFALRGVVAYAGPAGLAVRLLDLRTSADTVGEPGRVVGYGAFAIERG